MISQAQRILAGLLFAVLFLSTQAYTQGNQDEDTKYIQKVAPRVRMTVEKMIKAGVNPTTPDVGKTFSSFRQRVDDEGRLLVYLELSEFSDRVFHKLMQMGLSDTNQVFPEFKALHGWIPFHKVRPIANQKEVLKIINIRPITEDRSKWPREWKITTNQLLELAASIEEAAFSDESLDFSPFSTEEVPVDEKGRIKVNLAFTTFNAELVANLRALGCVVPDTISQILRNMKIIEGALIPYDRLIDVARIDKIVAIRRPTFVTVRSGFFHTEGDSVMRGTDVRNLAGFDGDKVKIGVISDGVKDTNTVPLGELPSDLTVILDVEGLAEGRAMLEIIHDMVPNSKLLFSTGILGIEVFTLSLGELARRGCGVIVDDIGFYADEPVFEDSELSLLIDSLSVEPVTYVSAAGNDAEFHFEDEFDPGGRRSFLGVVHDASRVDIIIDEIHLFDGTDSQRVLLGPRSKVAIFLQWNDKWEGRATSDYNVYGFNSTFDTLWGKSDDVQEGDRSTPLEWFTYENLKNSVDTLHVIVGRDSGAAAQRLAIYYFPRKGQSRVLNSVVAAGSVFGHPAARAAVAVGAVPWFDTNQIEPFSSQGPRRIYFEPSSNQRLMPPMFRPVPDVLGTDGVQMSHPLFNPFFGTSAAAPHVAAIAAMVKQAFPHLTAAEIKERIQRAGDRFDETQPNSGHSNVFGFGLVDARKAVSSPRFLVEGINGGSDHLLNTTPEPGNPRQEVAGLVLTAAEKPKVAYLDTLAFSIPSTQQQGPFKLASLGGTPRTAQFVGPGEIESLSLWWDRNRNEEADAADSLLRTLPFSEKVVFDTLRFKFDSTGAALLLTADVKPAADTTKTICVELPDTNSAVAFFFVRALNENFPFLCPEGRPPSMPEALQGTPNRSTMTVDLIWRQSQPDSADFYRIFRRKSW